ncbi:hypothetical protein ACFSVM_25565 [Paenibacillus shunpengii]|uniref:Stage III sporulation protein AD n=1 Tax=Paenibacillus shunpengii TaxID=2054424 RepID=A0ABW5SXJ1_9BACL
MTMSFRMHNGCMVDVSTICPAAPESERPMHAILEHIDRHKAIYRIGVITLTILLGLGSAEVMAAAVEASTLDVGAERLYMKLVRIGKWVIIIKGAFDTITATVQGDFISARKSGLSYLLVYVILLGLPWAFGQVESLFEGM